MACPCSTSVCGRGSITPCALVLVFLKERGPTRAYPSLHARNPSRMQIAKEPSICGTRAPFKAHSDYMQQLELDQLPGRYVCTEVELKPSTKKDFKAKPPRRLLVKSLNFDRSFVPATFRPLPCYLAVESRLCFSYISGWLGAGAGVFCVLHDQALTTSNTCHIAPSQCLIV